MVAAQGGDTSYIGNPDKFELAKNQVPVYSIKKGYVKSINALEIGLSSMQLGGGRETMDDVIDMSAGILLNKKVGDFVSEGELLCVLHTNKDENVYNAIAKDVLNSFDIVDEFVPKEKVIKEVIL